MKPEIKVLRKKKDSFLHDTNAVSEVLGILLILAVITSALIMYFAIQIPIWNERAEFDHIEVVYEDMLFLKLDIDDVAQYFTPKSSSIHLGTWYPSRKLIMKADSGGASGTLAVNTDLQIVINYTDLVNNNYSKTYNSSSLFYDLHGRGDTPQLVYEHGVILREFGTANVSTDTQSLIEDNDIRIPIIQATTSSTSSIGAESLEIYPCLETEIIDRIKYVNITLDTNYPKVWKKLLKDVNTTNTTVYVTDDNKIHIDTDATTAMVLPVMKSSYGGIYAGVAEILTYFHQDRFVSGVPFETGEYYLNKKSPFWINIPESSAITKFIITDLGFQDSHDAKLQFEVFDWDENATKWKCEIKFFDEPAPNTYIKEIKLEIKDGPKYESTTYTDNLNLTYDPDVGIDLLNLPTQYPGLSGSAQYYNASYTEAAVNWPNLLQVKKTDKLFYVAFKIG